MSVTSIIRKAHNINECILNMVHNGSNNAMLARGRSMEESFCAGALQNIGGSPIPHAFCWANCRLLARGISVPFKLFYPSHPAIQAHNADRWSNVPACRLLAHGGRSRAMSPPFLSTGDRHHRGWEARACDGARIQERRRLKLLRHASRAPPSLPGANEVLAPKHGSTSRHLHFNLC